MSWTNIVIIIYYFILMKSRRKLILHNRTNSVQQNSNQQQLYRLTKLTKIQLSGSRTGLDFQNLALNPPNCGDVVVFRGWWAWSEKFNFQACGLGLTFEISLWAHQTVGMWLFFRGWWPEAKQAWKQGLSGS